MKARVITTACVFSAITIAAIAFSIAAPSLLTAYLITPGFVVAGVLEGWLRHSFFGLFEVAVAVDCLIYATASFVIVRLFKLSLRGHVA